MAYLLRVPLGEGTSVLVEADRSEIPENLTLAAQPEPGRVAAAATRTLAASLEDLQPFLEAIKDRLVAAGPQDFAVEFGVKVGGETGIILAKGTAEVNFKVTMSWHRPEANSDDSDAPG